MICGEFTQSPEDCMAAIRIAERCAMDQKRELVEVLSRETERIAGCAVESVYFVIDDVKKENWGAGGQLCADKYPE